MMLPLNEQPNPKRYWIFLSLMLLVIAWCANPWQLYFLNDDFIHIPMTYDGTIGHHNSLRHINDFSLYLDSLLSKENAVGYHITNLLLHVANTLMGVFVFRCISQSLQVPFSTPLAILSAALFGIYAFHSEALFWIICRTASLSFFFNSISWLCLFKAVNKRIWLLPMVVLFLLGLFTYEAVWVFPFWLVAWYFLLPKNSWYRTRSVLPIVLIWILFIAYFPIRLAVTGELLGSYEAGDVQQAHVLPIVEKTLKLFGRSFLPPVYSHKGFTLLFAGVLVALVVWAVLLWKRAKANRLLLFFTIAWLIAYFPYISLGISTTGYESERYLYFPSFFLCAFLVYSAALIWQQKVLSFYLFVTGLFLYHLFFFIKVSQDFKTISRYASAGINAMRQTVPQKQLLIQNLPSYSYGLPVFNYGFTEAVSWLVPGRDAASVKVLSKTNFEKKRISTTLHRGVQADTLTFYGQ